MSQKKNHKLYVHSLFEVIVLMALSFFANDCFAERQRLVRIVWDVGMSEFYYRAEDLNNTTPGTWVVPAKENMVSSGFIYFKSKTDVVLKKGDQVRLYLVNYNPVSHVHETTNIKIIPPEPSTVGGIINAAALTLRGGSIPGVSLSMLREHTPPPPTCTIDAYQETFDKYSQLVTKTNEDGTKEDGIITIVRFELLKLPTTSTDLKLQQVSEAFASAGLADPVWTAFDNEKAWKELKHYVQAYCEANSDAESVTKCPKHVGDDFVKDHFVDLDNSVKKIRDNLKVIPSELLSIDTNYKKLPPKTPIGCFEIKESLDLLKESLWIEYMNLSNVAGIPVSVVGTTENFYAVGPFQEAAIIATYTSVKKQFGTFKGKLLNGTWTDQAVEVPVKEDMTERSSIRFDAVFKSPEKDVDRKIQASAVLPVAVNFPRLVVAAGLGYNDFDFHKMAIVKELDATGAPKDKLVIVNDDSYQQLMPVWLEHIKVAEFGNAAALYGTFGTTPDRNIFKNIIVGGSVYRPQWRTMFSLGWMGATGDTEETLTPIVQEFSGSDGFALAGVNATNIPNPDDRWHGTIYFSASFTLFSR